MPCVARIEPLKKFKPPCRGQMEFVEEQGRAAFCPTQHRKLSRVVRRQAYEQMAPTEVARA
jgi:hypothetical protein